MTPTKTAGQLESADGAAWETPDLDHVYRAYAADVSRWIQRLAGPSRREAVEDLLHETFLVVEQKLPTYRGDAQLRTWLYAIAVRVVVSHRRKLRLRKLLFLRAEPELRLGAPPAETPLGVLEREQASTIVYRVLDRLSERDRALLVLFELEGLPSAEVASILGVSLGNVWVSLTRARARFRAALAKSYPELSKGGFHEAR